MMDPAADVSTSLFANRYRIVAKLGTGGSSDVFLAKCDEHPSPVAIKVLDRFLAGDTTIVERFRREAAALANLKHPNVVGVISSGRAEAGHFMVMEYLDGESLETRLQRVGNVPWAEAVQWMRQAAQGLSAIHKENVLHRDLKPANIQLTSRGRIVLMDFGLALTETHHSRLTAGQFVPGTEAYLAPEVLQGDDASAASDIYSLGVVFYELITGELPLPPVNLPDASGRDPSLNVGRDSALASRGNLTQGLEANAPAGLVTIIQRMLAASPQSRYRSADELLEALDSLCMADAETVEISHPPGGEPTVRIGVPKARHLLARRYAILAVLGMLLVAAFAISSRPSVRQNLADRTVASTVEASPDLRTEVADALSAPAEEPVLDFDQERKPDVMVADAAWLQLDLTERDFVNSVGMKLVWIEPGTFWMGHMDVAPLRHDFMEYALPVHEVTITKGFYMGAYEVTRRQYETVMGLRSEDEADDALDEQTKRRDNSPIGSINWRLAAEFCVRLSQRREEKERGVFYRLPTEAEWEYACRAGTDTLYYWGDDEGCIGQHAWTLDNSNLRLQPVGQLLPNPWGLYDMYGNVSEWCQDWFTADYYQHSPKVDPQGPPAGPRRSLKVIRGGNVAYTVSTGFTQSATRLGFYETGYRHYIGMRVVAQKRPEKDN